MLSSICCNGSFNSFILHCTLCTAGSIAVYYMRRLKESYILASGVSAKRRLPRLDIQEQANLPVSTHSNCIAPWPRHDRLDRAYSRRDTELLGCSAACPAVH